MKPTLIGEVKTKSPFGYQSTKSFEQQLFTVLKYADIISIHTSPEFGGSFELLKEVCQFSKKPVLAKGWHPNNEDIGKALTAGASYVLVVDRVPTTYINQPEKLFIEPLDPDNIRFIPRHYKVVLNQRNLNTGKLRPLRLFKEYQQWSESPLVQASFIKTKHDVDPLAKYLLIGEHFEQFVTTV